MPSLVSRRACAVTSSLLLIAIALPGRSLFGGGSSKTIDISKLPNTPQGQKQRLIQQVQSTSGDQKKQTTERVVALNSMAGMQLVGVEPSLITSQQLKLDPEGQAMVNKNDTVYQMMSTTDSWQLGNDTYDLCVGQNCEYCSSRTMGVEGSSSDLTYVWILKIEGSDQPDEPLIRYFKVAK